MDGFEDPLFKGCTRPPVMADVPMVPFLLVTGLFIVLAMYAFMLKLYALAVGFIILYLPVYFWMRLETKRDEHRLSQMVLKLRLRLRMLPARAYWGAISYSPLRYKRRNQ